MSVYIYIYLNIYIYKCKEICIYIYINILAQDASAKKCCSAQASLPSCLLCEGKCFKYKIHLTHT